MLNHNLNSHLVKIVGIISGIKRKDLLIAIYIAWVVFSVLWIFDNGACPPNSYIKHNQVVSYSHLHNHYRFSPFSHPVSILVVTILFGVKLIFATNRTWLTNCLLLLVPFTCLVAFGSLFCDYTDFTHLDTAEFDGSVYHLAFEEDHTADTNPYQHLSLYTCGMDGEQCRGRHIAATEVYGEAKESFGLSVDDRTNQLQVKDGAEIIFTLEAGVDLFSLP